ncbi:unnamed protein product [Larinioides sclopetarius]|uniref:Aminotransferase class I/classII large domain-containing protein n=1 Tax=Larinioides sclopetarius TaxID=280406 RepID=A0AAV1ZW62_9ARAC
MTEFFETHEPVNPENLFCVSGVTGCIDILAHCLANPGDVILAPTPIYGRIYTNVMQRARVKLWHIPVITEHNGASSEFLTIEKVKKAYNDAVSKDFGLAGLRIGVIHTQCEALQKCLKQLCFLQCIPFPIMNIAAKFLEDIEWCKMYITTYQERLSESFKHCIERVKEMGLNARESSGGFFLWIDLRPICGSDSFEKEMDLFNYLLEDYHVYIVPGKELFCAQPGWFRVTFTTHPEEVDEGFKRLEEGIKKYKSAKG